MAMLVKLGILFGSVIWNEMCVTAHPHPKYRLSGFAAFSAHLGVQQSEFCHFEGETFVLFLQTRKQCACHPPNSQKRLINIHIKVLNALITSCHHHCHLHVISPHCPEMSWRKPVPRTRSPPCWARCPPPPRCRSRPRRAHGPRGARSWGRSWPFQRRTRRSLYCRLGKNDEGRTND